MKKLLSLALIGALALSLTACGNSSSKDNPSSKETTTTKKEEKKEPLDLTGTWQCDPVDGTYLKATISNNVIEIDWVLLTKIKAQYIGLVLMMHLLLMLININGHQIMIMSKLRLLF